MKSLRQWIFERKLGKIWRRPPEIWTSVNGERMKVSEGARKQAAINMREDPEKKELIEKMLGGAEAKRRYPEAYVKK